jgi:hypothetical protein
MSIVFCFALNLGSVRPLTPCDLRSLSDLSALIAIFTSSSSVYIPLSFPLTSNTLFLVPAVFCCILIVAILAFLIAVF